MGLHVDSTIVEVTPSMGCGIKRITNRRHRISEKVQSLPHSMVEGERKVLGTDVFFSCAQQVKTTSRNDGLNIVGIHLLIIPTDSIASRNMRPNLEPKTLTLGMSLDDDCVIFSSSA